MRLTGLLQAAGSWSVDACCAVHGNDCHRDPGTYNSHPYCLDHTSSSDWLFGLWPGPPQRFEPTGTSTQYQWVREDWWPLWGHRYDHASGPTSDLFIGKSGAPGGLDGSCGQGVAYHGTDGEICGRERNWGATDVEVWYPI